MIWECGLSSDPAASELWWDGTDVAPEDVVRRISAERTFVDERGAVGIRLEPAAAIVRQYGKQFRALRRQRRPPAGETVGSALSGPNIAALRARRSQAGNHAIEKARVRGGLLLELKEGKPPLAAAVFALIYPRSAEIMNMTI